MRYALAGLALLALTGCAVHRGETGFSYSFGQSGVCSGVYNETADAWSCRGSYTHGGALSETAKDSVTGAVGAARAGAATALGVPQ